MIFSTQGFNRGNRDIFNASTEAAVPPGWKVRWRVRAVVRLGQTITVLTGTIAAGKSGTGRKGGTRGTRMRLRYLLFKLIIFVLTP